MPNSDITELQTLVLGELAPLFDEYVGIVNSVPEDAPDIKVPHHPDIADDSWVKAREKLARSSTKVQFQEAQVSSQYNTPPALARALRQRTFLGINSKLL